MERKRGLEEENGVEKRIQKKERKAPREGRCHFFIERKNKYCSHYSVVGNFCNMHGGASEKHGKRVPCPVNGNHTVFESRLAKHILVCNEAKKQKELESKPYFHKNLNVSTYQSTQASTSVDADKGKQDQPEEKSRLFDFDIHEQDQLILRLDALLEAAGVTGEDRTHFTNVTDQDLPRESTEDSASNGTNNKGRNRHTEQEDAIINNALSILGTRESTIPNGSCLVEMGAGKGGLSLRASSRLGSDRTGYFVLVDRASAKHQKVPQIVAENNRYVEKVRIDIRDLDLWRVPLVERFLSERLPESKMIMGSKHLCGDATCFTLRCAVANKVSKPDALVIALCCHNRCTLGGYINPEFVLETLKLTPREFDMVRRMSSWATCASEKRTLEKQAKEKEEIRHKSANEFEMPALEISDEERTRIGLKCKLLLNYGRLLFLRSHGFQAKLVKYAAKSTTLENTLLVARPLERPNE